MLHIKHAQKKCMIVMQYKSKNQMPLVTLDTLSLGNSVYLP